MPPSSQQPEGAQIYCLTQTHMEESTTPQTSYHLIQSFVFYDIRPLGKTVGYAYLTPSSIKLSELHNKDKIDYKRKQI